ncbi:hypothetical protein CANMA_001025 [Candida margitis]|uniref:uncharacterized protein n=1 Tax=Candida margitis TaxID=1775924 RepID=UPI0022277539|nr:uncharacterized protein CANMA_001025 [Candida margitis]KAI5969985.1 hypothetical protein CANMA_001025 [Candida margitis]
MNKVGPILRRVAIRRSRAVLLLFILLVIHIFIASYVHDTPIKQYIADNVPIPQLKQLLLTNESVRNGTEFDTTVLEYIQKQKDISTNIPARIDDKTKEQIEVTKQVLEGTTYTTDDSFNIITIPPKEQIPAFSKYDPRYTFGMLLRYINANVDSQEVEQSSQKLTIPAFHWADYVDMSALEKYLFNPEKEPCSYFDTTVRNPKKNEREHFFKPETYCVSDDDIDRILKDPEAQARYTPDIITAFQRIQREQESLPSLTTGFHIFNPAGRNMRSKRPVLSRSYLYDFMQVPLTVTFLLPGEKSLQLNVNQAQHTKLKDSNIYQQGEINVKDEITLLANKLTKTGGDLFPEKHLTHEQFIDSSAKNAASLESSRTQLNQTDQNYLQALKTSLGEQDPWKYFNEAYILRREANFALGSHYDWRFMNGIVNGTPKQGISINGLLKAFLRLTNQYNINTWIAHGSLLSWYWNGLQFPWDADIDVQMPISDLHRFTQLFNQTVVFDFGTDLNQETRFGRYFLDSSTFISHRSRGNGKNNIDARFIDMDTGLYIDITGLAISDMPTPRRYNFLLTKTKYASKENDNSINPIEKNNFLQIYNCRNAHFSKLQEISPLRLNLVQGEFGYVPYDFEGMLHAEYRAKGTSSTFFAGHVFLPKLRIWVDKNSVLRFVTNGGKNDGQGRMQRITQGDANIITVTLTDDEYIEYLYQNKPVLRDFIATHQITLLHTLELRKLVTSKSSLRKFLKENAGIYGFGDVDVDAKLTEPKQASLQLDFFVNQVRNAEMGYNFNDELKKLNDKIQQNEADYQKRLNPGMVEKFKKELWAEKKEKEEENEDKGQKGRKKTKRATK